VPWAPPAWPTRLGRTTVRLPLGGLASTEVEKVRRPLVRPFWLMAVSVAMTVSLLVWLRVSLF